MPGNNSKVAPPKSIRPNLLRQAPRRPWSFGKPITPACGSIEAVHQAQVYISRLVVLFPDVFLQQAVQVLITCTIALG